MEGYTLVSHNYARGFDFDQIDKKNQTQGKSEMQKKKKIYIKKIGKFEKKMLIVQEFSDFS